MYVSECLLSDVLEMCFEVLNDVQLLFHSLFGIGSRSALLNMEARGSAAKILSRKCVIIRWMELSSDLFLELIQRGTGSLLVLIPQDWSTQDNETLTVCSLHCAVHSNHF